MKLINKKQKKEKNDHFIQPKQSFGQKAADKLTIICGSWPFIISLLFFMVAWIILNITIVIYTWDPYPFHLLNVILACLVTIQAPIILLSQNRAAERDRIEVERDYALNRKAEREIEEIQRKLDYISSKIKKR